MSRAGSASAEALRRRFRVALECNAGGPLSRAELIWLFLRSWSAEAGDVQAAALLRAAVDVDGELELLDQVALEDRLEAAGKAITRVTCSPCRAWATETHLATVAHYHAAVQAARAERARLAGAPSSGRAR